MTTNGSAGVRKYLLICSSDTPEEDVTEEDQTDQPSKAAKRKRPTEKGATKKKKSEQVSEQYRPSDVLHNQVSIFPLYGSNIDVCRCFDLKIFPNWAEMLATVLADDIVHVGSRSSRSWLLKAELRERLDLMKVL